MIPGATTSHAGLGQATVSLLTAPGKGGIAVILLRGEGSRQILSKIFIARPSHISDTPGRLQLGYLIDSGGAILDEAIVHRCDDHVEINIHGGPKVVGNVLEAICNSGAVLERPDNANTSAGLRADHPQWNNPSIGREMLELLPGCRSLLAAEAISRQWSGGISALANRARESGTLSANQSLAAQLAQASEGFGLMRRLIQPCEVVLAGKPNAGKSTLANLLLGRQASIVHQTPGTTRDYVRELVLVDGVPIWLTDTAGLWHAPDDNGPLQHAVDSEAVSRARGRIDQADMVILLMHEATQTDIVSQTPRVLRVWSKCDISRPPATLGLDLAVSAQSGEGIAELKQAICCGLGLGDIDLSLPRAFTQRQAELLAKASRSMTNGDADSARALLDQLLSG